MSFTDLLAFALGALGGHRLRTDLSLLGMGIGVAAVVVLTGLGEGARSYVVGQFTQIGSNLVIVIPGRNETTGACPGVAGVPNDLTLDDALASARQVPEVVRVADLRPALPAGEDAPTRSTTTPSTPRRRATESSRMLTPRPTRVGRPFSMICGTTRWMTVCGTAKPMPADEPLLLKIIVFMPMTWPSMSNSGPPELPWLMAASV